MEDQTDNTMQDHMETAMQSLGLLCAQAPREQLTVSCSFPRGKKPKLPKLTTRRWQINYGCVPESPSNTDLCCGPLFQTRLSRASGAGRWGGCRGVGRMTCLSVTTLCRGVPPEACYNPNVFESLPYGFFRR